MKQKLINLYKTILLYFNPYLNHKYSGHHPTVKQVNTIIDRLSTYNKNYSNSKLDMGESSVIDTNNNGEMTHACGTVHCHAGNYLVACLDEKLLLKKPVMSYQYGQFLMVNHLGFKSQLHLKRWAYSNPKLWGNEYGNYMFSGKKAFTNKYTRPTGALNNKHIVDHWTEVRDRMIKAGL